MQLTSTAQALLSQYALAAGVSEDEVASDIIVEAISAHIRRIRIAYHTRGRRLTPQERQLIAMDLPGDGGEADTL